MDYTLIGQTSYLVLCILYSVEAATRCYSCAGLSNPHDCQTIAPCTSSQQCFTRSYISDVLTVKFDLGCQDNDFCSVLSKRSSLSLMPQDVPDVFTHQAMTSSKAEVRRKRQLEAPLCTQCCDKGEHCNIDLCKNSLVSRPPGLKCYDCGNSLLNDPADCTTVRVCSPGESCHVSEVVGSSGSKFVVKCLSQAVCQIIGDSILFGRKKRDRYLCHTCCDTDHCNIDYCSHSRPLPTGSIKTTKLTTPTTPTTTASTTMKTLPLVSVQSPYDVTREAESFPLTYRCQVTGLPAPSYTWEFKDNTGNSRNVDNLAKSQSGLSILTLDPVVPQNEGTYTCRASNGVDTLTTNGSLTVFSQVVSKYPDVQTVTSKEGDDVSLVCDFTSYPDVSISWYRIDSNGNLNDSSGLPVSSDKTILTFKAVGKDKSGQYACVGENGFRNATVKYTLDVAYQPAFVSLPPDQISVSEHGTLMFSCQAAGNPPPTYGFSFVDSNSNPSIVTGAVIYSDNGTLVISDVNSRYDQGTLTCRVANKYGFIEHSVHVVVS